MTEDNKQKSNLQKALDLDAEIENWDSEVHRRILQIQQQMQQAEAAGDSKKLAQLTENFDRWLQVDREGYSNAQESELGREILDSVREQKKESDARLAAYRKKQKEPINSSK